MQHNAYEEDPYANEFGIRISEKMTSVEARVLPAPWVRLWLFFSEEKNFLLLQMVKCSTPDLHYYLNDAVEIS